MSRPLCVSRQMPQNTDPIAPPLPAPSWPQSPAGAYVLAWQAERYAALLEGIFGYYALQLGLPECLGLAACRMPHRWLMLQTPQGQANAGQAQLWGDFHQLPLQEGSVDLLLLPHTLEQSAQPAATLRDAARALRPQGHVLISGFHAQSAWYALGLSRRRQALGLPAAAQLPTLPALRQQLQALGLEVLHAEYGVWQPLRAPQAGYGPVQTIERWGQRLLPHLGACFVLLAQKRVLGGTALHPEWARPKAWHSELGLAGLAPASKTHPPAPAQRNTTAYDDPAPHLARP